MNNINYEELFGVEAAEEKGVEQGTEEATQFESDEEHEDSFEGEKEKDVADPAEGEEEAEDSEGEQPIEERRKYAAARRKAEAQRDEAIAQAKLDAAHTVDEVIKSMGLTNPYTRKPIISKAEYDEYRTTFETEKKNRLLRKMGMSETEYSEFIEGLPEVREAREAKKKAETAAQRAQEAETKAIIEEQLRKIGELDPSIKTLADLTKKDNYTEFYALVKRGNTLQDAYKIANFEAITKGSIAATRQSAINAVKSKEHLKTTVSRGPGAAAVPNEVRDAYRVFNPNASEAEIQQHYNNYMKRKGK